MSKYFLTNSNLYGSNTLLKMLRFTESAADNGSIKCRHGKIVYTIP